MSLDTGIVTLLTSTATAVSAIVGSRVHGMAVPRGSAMPAVVYQRVAADRIRSHDGPANLARPRYQITSWAETHDGAVTLAAAVRAAMDCAAGTWGSDVVQVCFLEGETHLYDDGTEIDRPRYGVAQDYAFLHNE